MRNSRSCPKCRSTDIVRIPGDIRGHGQGNNIRVGWTIFSAVKVTRYLWGRANLPRINSERINTLRSCYEITFTT